MLIMLLLAGIILFLYIFIKQQSDDIDVRLIDLEAAKQRWRRKSAYLRDLDTLNRHSLEWSRADRLRFLLKYTGRSKMDAGVKTLWRQLDKKREKKYIQYIRRRT